MGDYLTKKEISIRERILKEFEGKELVKISYLKKKYGSKYVKLFYNLGYYYELKTGYYRKF